MFSWLRWQKMMRDMRNGRSFLVVLCLAIGASIVGTMLNTQAVLTANINRQFRDANAASAVLTIPEGFDREFVAAIRRIPAIQDAEGRGVIQSRIRVGPDTFVRIRLIALDRFDDIQVDKLRSDGGAWPPGKRALVIERSSMQLQQLSGLQIGDTLSLEKREGRLTAVTLAGRAYDFNQEPASQSGVAYGYITLDTLEALGAPRSFNQLLITVADKRLDRSAVERAVQEVEQKVRNSGRTVGSVNIPEPGKYVLADAFSGLSVALIGLGSLTLVGGVFLVINTVTALIAQQIRQIGTIKALGARSGQVTALYLGMVIVYSLLALAVALPLAALGGSWLSGMLGAAFNLELQGARVPLSSLAVEAGIVVLAPLAAALYPIVASTRVTAREAMSNYGISASALGGSWIERLIMCIQWLPRPVALSLRNAFRRRSRLILTLTALMLSGAVFMAAANVRAALNATVEGIFTYRSYQIRAFFTRPYRSVRIEQSALSVPGVRRAEGYNYTLDAYRTHADASIGNDIAVLALDPASRMLRPPVVAGRWLQPTDQAAIVVNTALLREEPDIQLGDSVVFKIGQRDSVALRVVGVVEETLATPGIYLNNTYFMRSIATAGSVNSAWFVVEGRDPAAVARDLEARFKQQSLTVQRIDTVGDEKTLVVAHATVLTLFLQVMSVLLVIVGGLGLMGIMSINVIERQREIGMMRAVGASRRAILRIVMSEGVFVGVLSWLLSMVATAAATKLIGDAVGNQFLKAALRFTFAPAGVLLWLAIIVVIAALACYLPARQATTLEVRELLAYE